MKKKKKSICLFLAITISAKFYLICRLPLCLPPSRPLSVPAALTATSCNNSSTLNIVLLLHESYYHSRKMAATIPPPRQAQCRESDSQDSVIQDTVIQDTVIKDSVNETSAERRPSCSSVIQMTF